MEVVYAPSDDYHGNTAPSNGSTAPRNSYHGNQDLFTAAAMHDMCRSEEHFIIRHLKPLAVRVGNDQTVSLIQCRAFSLPYFIMLITKKQSCYDIDTKDMQQVKSLLEMCYPLYKNGNLTENAKTSQRYEESGNNSGAKEQLCYNCNYIYSIFQFILETNVMSIDKSGKATLGPVKISQLIMPNIGYKQGGSNKYFLEVIDDKNLQTGSVKIIGLFRTASRKVALFSHYIKQDLWLFGFAIALILLIMYLYLHSLLLVIATIANIVFAYIIAYFIYRVVFGIEFFSFINLLAGVVIIAVAADDIFIFHDFWCLFRGAQGATLSKATQTLSTQFRNKCLAQIMTKTFKHASSSIFVTSFTTSAAFFSNCASNITSLKAFGLFSGIVILANFFLMVTWTPAVIISIEKLTYTQPYLYMSDLLEKYCGILQSVGKLISQFFQSLEHLVFRRVLPYLVTVCWWVIFILLVGMGVVGCFLLFQWPKLKLPQSPYVQVFSKGSVMIIENYERELNHRFAYGQSSDAHVSQPLRPLHYIWGVLPKDNAGIFNGKATDSATLIPDNSFNMSSMEAQAWVMNLCDNIQKQEYIDKSFNVICMFDYYLDILKVARNSTKVKYLSLLKTCDKIKEFPIEPWRFELCLPLLDSIAHMPNVTKLLGLSNTEVIGKPIYDQHNKPSGYWLPIYTKFHGSNDHQWMDMLYKKLDGFHANNTASSVTGLRHGWWVVYPDFILYNMQNVIETGVFYSIGISLLATMSMMFLTSLNIVITLYAILTISLAIISTLAALVLNGWILNVIESMTLSLAVGLSIDFTIHFGVAYKLSREQLSSLRVTQAMSNVGPAVFMASFTTFLAGLAMMPARIVAFKQLGTFLMLVMMFSWVYSNLFFQGLLSKWGPNGDDWQLSMNKVKLLWAKLWQRDVNRINRRMPRLDLEWTSQEQSI